MVLTRGVDIETENPAAPPVRLVQRVSAAVRANSLSRRALGQFALIVVGVLVALWVNNWNTDRGRVRTAKVFLGSIRTALSTDLVLLQQADTGYRERERLMIALIGHIDRGDRYSDSLRPLFGAVYGLWTVPLNRAPYEALKATDLSLVTRDSLRMDLAELYERTYADLADAEATDRNAIFEVLRPYFLQSFRDIRFRESATPLRPEAVLRDPYFRNLVEYRLAVLRANQLSSTTRAIATVRATLGRVEAELRRIQ